jgi:hypothetical protein
VKKLSGIDAWLPDDMPKDTVLFGTDKSDPEFEKLNVTGLGAPVRLREPFYEVDRTIDLEFFKPSPPEPVTVRARKWLGRKLAEVARKISDDYNE